MKKKIIISIVLSATFLGLLVKILFNQGYIQVFKGQCSGGTIAVCKLVPGWDVYVGGKLVYEKKCSAQCGFEDK